MLKQILFPFFTRTSFGTSQNLKTSFRFSSFSYDTVDREKKLKILQLEVDVCRQDGRRAPDPANIKPQQWEEILAFTSRSARYKYYAFLWQIEKRKENEKALKEKKRLEIEEKRAMEPEEGHISYRLGQNTMFLRIYDTTVNLWKNNKLVNAMQFGQKLVIDCGYDDHMVKREAKNAAKQLMLLFADNRSHTEPFDLHFCNANFDKETMKELEKFIPTLRDPEFPMNMHEESYLDLFAKEKLVYLTPHCRTDLTHFDLDDIYIVGAMVDKMNNDPLSLAKAKSQGLRMARLPLDSYLDWGAGSGKSLTINQMLNILHDIMQTGDWNQALKHVPRRKLVHFEQPVQQKVLKFKEYQYKFENRRPTRFKEHAEQRVERKLQPKRTIKELLELKE